MKRRHNAEKRKRKTETATAFEGNHCHCFLLFFCSHQPAAFWPFISIWKIKIRIRWSKHNFQPLFNKQHSKRYNQMLGYGLKRHKRSLKIDLKFEIQQKILQFRVPFCSWFMFMDSHKVFVLGRLHPSLCNVLNLVSVQTGPQYQLYWKESTPEATSESVYPSSDMKVESGRIG